MLIAAVILAFAAFTLGGLVGFLAGQEVTARRADRYIDRLHDKLRLLCRLVAKEGK